MPERVGNDTHEPIFDEKLQKWVYAKNREGKPICAYPKKNGGRCLVTVIYPNGRCRAHGGADGSVYKAMRVPDQALAKLKTRREVIAAQLPDDLQDVFNESLDDPLQTSMKIELALADANLARVVKMLSDTPSDENWEDLRELSDELEEAINAERFGSVAAVHNKLKDMAYRGSNHGRVWGEVAETSQAKAKLSEAETRRLSASRVILSIQEAELMITTLFQCLVRSVQNPDIPREGLLKAVRENFIKEMSLPDRPNNDDVVYEPTTEQGLVPVHSYDDEDDDI